MIRNILTIRFEEDEQGLSFDAFADIARSTVAILRSLDRAASSEHKETMRWLIADISKRSPMEMTLEAASLQGRSGSDVVTQFLEDMDRLEHGNESRYLSRSLQQHAKRIAERVGRGIRGLVFARNGTETRTTQRVAATVTESLGAVHYEIGSIEGRLDLINVHGGKDLVKVWDRRWNIPVECRLSESQLIDAVAALSRRVTVRGRIMYRGRFPCTITDVYDITAIPGEDELPQLANLGPIDLFGDTNPADYLTGVTDDD